MLRFSIRDALWLMLVVGLSIGWWIDRRELHRQMARMKTDWQMQNAVDDVGRKSGAQYRR